MRTMLKYSLTVLLLTANLLAAQTIRRVLLDGPHIEPDRIESTVLLEFRLSDRTNSGSGFFFENTDGKMYIITACHVLSHPTNVTFKLYGPKIAITFCGDIYKSDEATIGIDLDNLNKKGFLKYSKEKDVAVFRIGQVITNNMHFLVEDNYEILNQGTNPQIHGVIHDRLCAFTNVTLSSDIFLVGYPKSLGIANVPQIYYNKPLLRKGIIAGINKEKKTFIIDAPVYPGNSGGPVYQFDSPNKLIGIVTQLIPYVNAFGNICTVTNIITLPNNMTLTNMFTVTNTFAYSNNSGYAVAVPVEYAVELIKQIK